MGKRYLNNNIFCFGDPHIPYQAEYSFTFFKNIKKRFEPDRVVCLGDLIDGYNGSRWPKDPNHPDSWFHEIKKVKRNVKQLTRIFPNVLMCLGNHEERFTLKANGAGIPTSMLRPLKDILELPSGWKIAEEHRLTVDKTRGKILFAHRRSTNVLLGAQRMGHTLVVGHEHSKAGVQAYSNGERIYYGVNVPSMISNRGAPFRYAKLCDINPIRGGIIIANGVPRMLLSDKKGNIIN